MIFGIELLVYYRYGHEGIEVRKPFARDVLEASRPYGRVEGLHAPHGGFVKSSRALVPLPFGELDEVFA